MKLTSSSRGLSIPTKLTVSVFVAATASCNTNPITDASPDTGADVVADNTNDIASDTTATDVVGDLVVSDACVDPPRFGEGFACYPTRGAAPGTVCPSALTCNAATCAAVPGCAGCAFSMNSFEFGVACLPDVRADVMANCPRRVCTAADCPTGCVSCPGALFCIPDSTSDVRVTSCSPSETCSPDGCGPGCRAVG